MNLNSEPLRKYIAGLDKTFSVLTIKLRLEIVHILYDLSIINTLLISIALPIRTNKIIFRTTAFESLVIFKLDVSIKSCRGQG